MLKALIKTNFFEAIKHKNQNKGDFFTPRQNVFRFWTS